MSQTSNARWLICRICLKGENKKLYKIFEPINEEEITSDLGTILVDKIELCGAITLNQQNNLPNKICSRCVLLLRAAYKFRDLCQQSQNQLIEFISTIPQNKQSVENLTIKYDIDVEEEKSKLQEEADKEKLADDSDYVIEESVVEFDESSYEPEQITDDKNSDHEEDNFEFQEFIDYENAEYVVEEVDVKDSDTEANQDQEDIIEALRKKPEIGIFTKRINEKKSVKRKRKQSQSEANNTVYNCVYCKNSYKHKTKYNNHLKLHIKDKPHECEICKKRFSTTPQLSRHMNSHTGNRPYKCQYCEASFGDPSTKIKHERIHTNERPYKCSLCNKSFSYSNVLKVHMMIHTGEKPHTCDYCGKAFSQIHHKNAHVKRHTKVNMVVVENSPDVEYMEEEDFKEYKIEEII